MKDDTFRNERRVSNPQVLTAREQSLMLGSSHPENSRMAQKPDIPQVLLQRAMTFKEVQALRRKQKEIESLPAAEYFGIEFTQGLIPILSVPDIDPITWHPIEVPRLVGLLDEESERIIRERLELSRYSMNEEALRAFSPAETISKLNERIA